MNKLAALQQQTDVVNCPHSALPIIPTCFFLLFKEF
jgi:hypothetical protein